MTHGYLIFHLNLAFSSIKTEDRPDVVRKCYWPLLDLIDRTGIPIGIELTGWTLSQIQAIDESWVQRFRELLAEGRCELIGSGWSQLIGPLVPHEVNSWNQRLGIDAYRSLLGVRPELVLVNEMAFSGGLVDVYAESGYRGIVMDRDNIRLALGLEHEALTETPTHAQGAGERALPVLWADSVLFQRFQRAVHGDIPISEYLEYVAQRARTDHTVLPIYCNDAEIFDYRPGRFTTESRLHAHGEWRRMQSLLQQVETVTDFAWLSPSNALQQCVREVPPKIRHLTTAAHPIPVKKQAKYNVNRWAVTGRDDLWLNTACHRRYRMLSACGEDRADPWRELCELWASDLRTHITADRWTETVARVERLDAGHAAPASPADVHASAPVRAASEAAAEISHDAEGLYWSIRTPAVSLVLNARRGLTIKALAFASQKHDPIIGTLNQGFFRGINHAADFYSGGVLAEIPGERARITDLEWATPDIRTEAGRVIARAQLKFGSGVLEKRIDIDPASERITLSYAFDGFKRPLGTVRVGIVTLLPESLQPPLRVSCKNGGGHDETLALDCEFNHGEPASSLVSSTAAFGATDGRFIIEDAATRGLILEWDPARCAAVPMLKHLRIGSSFLTRVWFSLSELDDTSRADGRLLPFSVSLRPR